MTDSTVIINNGDQYSTVIIGDAPIPVVIGETDIITAGQPEPITVVVADNPLTVVISEPEFVVIGPDIPGPPGTGGGASEADEVSYRNPTYATVQEALDAILYVAPKINSITNSGGTVEKGATVASVTLNWSFNKTMTSAAINGVPVDPASASTVIVGPFTSNQSWTLTASDGANTTSASTALTFAQKRYWGASALESLDDAAILGLGGSEFATSFNKSLSYDCSGGKYPYFVYPAAFGAPANVTVGGLAFSDFATSDQDFTNASGFASAYRVLRFRNLQTGANIVVGWA